jgi:hypothetical protein
VLSVVVFVNRDDGDDGEQFDQRKAGIARIFSWLHVLQ